MRISATHENEATRKDSVKRWIATLGVMLLMPTLAMA